MSVSVSRGSPVVTSEQSSDDGQCCFGSPHLAYLTAPAHRTTCSPSPALPRITRSPGQWSTSQRHTLQSACVMPLQQSDLGTTRTPSPWASRPVGDPMFHSGGTYRAQLRCPIHALQCAHCASPIGQGVVWKKADSIHTDGVGYTDVLPTSVRFHRWTLGFG